jgi:hypothetical protein
MVEAGRYGCLLSPSPLRVPVDEDIQKEILSTTLWRVPITLERVDEERPRLIYATRL